MEILGIDLGGTNIRAGQVEDDTLKQIAAAPIDSKEKEEDVLNLLYGLIDEVVTAETQGIGVGVPSVVDTKNGVVYDVQNIPSWKEVHLKELIQKRYNLPVYVNNDANCFAVGEKYFGKGKDYDSVVGLIMGTGLGSGLILNGKLYSGRNCGAGEFGMIPYLDQNYEYYCCGQFFYNNTRFTGAEAFAKAENGDTEALAYFNELGGHVGEAIKTILYSVDPEIIILGGSVSKAFRFFKDAMWERLSTFGFAQTIKNLKIEASEVDQVAILGAAALYLDAINNTACVF
jgi:glucokinase